MRASWQRRRTAMGDNPEIVNESAPEVRDNNQLDAFSRIEFACKLWKGLDTEKTWYQNSYPELTQIVENTITNLRLEIILTCKEYLNETD